MSKEQGPKQFADALKDFVNRAGWMQHLQNALTNENKALEGYSYRHDGDDDPYLLDKIGKTVGMMDEAWPEVCQTRRAVKTTAMIPPFPIGGMEPNRWTHEILVAVSELAELVGGIYEATPRLNMGPDQVERYFVLLNRLQEHIRELEELPDAIVEASTAGPQTSGITSAPPAESGTVDQNGAGADAMMLTGEDRAISILRQHPTWTPKQIAKAAGIHVKTLYRYQDFRSARAILERGRADIPRGQKDRDGNMEAWR